MIFSFLRTHFFFVVGVLSIIIITKTTLAQPEFLYYNCTYAYDFTTSSTFATNLNTLLPTLSSKINEYGYLNVSPGKQPDQVTSVSLCRGDIKADLCRTCVEDSIKKLSTLCPYQREVISWYDYCMFRYTNQTINFGTMEWGPGFNKRNVNFSVPDQYVSSFLELRRTLFLELSNNASSGDHRRKYATGNKNLGNYQTLYSLVQCTPDLSAVQCTNCVNACLELIPRCCNISVGGAVYKPTCNIRFELGTGPFYNETTMLMSPPAPTAQPILGPASDKLNNTVLIFIIVVPSIVFLVLAVYLVICWRNRNKQVKRKQKFETFVDGISTVESLQFDFDTIKEATNDFSELNKLGQGGFGTVYMGVLQKGDEFAVKRLSQGSQQGETEFKTEVMLMARLQHCNLVRLLGFCLEGTERLLIYELVFNGSLHHFLSSATNGVQLDWSTRCKIIGGIAMGLLYLHEDSRLRIIHRDLKASNILLDAEMNAKIADFGLARCFKFDESQGYIISRVADAGTYGYMAPEVFQGHVSVKTDVFAFGVLVLEIVTGKLSKSFGADENAESLLSRAWKMWRAGRASDLIESRMLNSSGSTQEIMRCIHIGLLCVQENVANKPTMSSVVLMLSSSSHTLAAPSRPAFFMRTASTDSSGSTENELLLPNSSQNESRNDDTITDMEAR